MADKCMNIHCGRYTITLFTNSINYTNNFHSILIPNLQRTDETKHLTSVPKTLRDLIANDKSKYSFKC